MGVLAAVYRFLDHRQALHVTSHASITHPTWCLLISYSLLSYQINRKADERSLLKEVVLGVYSSSFMGLGFLFMFLSFGIYL